MSHKIKPLLIAFLGLMLFASCEKNLDLVPEDTRETSASVFDDPDSYKQFLAKLYAGLAVSGQQGPSGHPDLVGLDEGFSQYLRLYWMMQELTTDEVVIGWNDGTIKDLHSQNWTDGNEFIRTMYSRIMYQVSLTNEFLRQTTDDKLTKRGVGEDLRAEIQKYRAEARFLRALSYYHSIDLFGNPPFVTAEDPISAFMPEQISRSDLFAYIESELLAIESEIVPARSNEYGRADQAAVWMLLSKLYLNAEIYTGTDRYADVITYTEKIIAAGYSLASEYQNLFLADNSTNGAQQEIIFAITQHGINSTSYGGVTFIIHAAIGGTMDPLAYGVSSGWAGLRTTPEFVSLFPNGADSNDNRALFYTDGQQLEITDISNFNHGYAVTKFKNIDSQGNQGSDGTGEFADTDFPLFRLADVYLMYAEAVVRGGGGTMGKAVGYVNQLRARAYVGGAQITAADLTLDFILAERGRELYWEAHRRTDLIRFHKFSQNKVWAFKGGVPQGTTTEAFRNLFPIPATDLAINSNLTQNPGY